MNKLPKEKLNQLVLVVLVSLGSVVGLYFGLIQSQQNALAKLNEQRDTARTKINQIRDTFKNGKQIETELAGVSAQLENQEKEMASGDFYGWMYNSISKFKQPYRVDIPQFSSVVVGDVNLLPKFPYKQVSITVSGTAYYHDLGRFIADYENEFPTSRILNLEMTPASTGGPDQEKLAFKMDIVSLIRPIQSKTGNAP